MDAAYLNKGAITILHSNLEPLDGELCSKTKDLLPMLIETYGAIGFSMVQCSQDLQKSPQIY